MELGLLIDVLMLVVPTAIAIVSLYYAMKQRSLVRSEISKKRYLENALSNLNEAISLLKSIDIPSLPTLWKDANAGYSKYGDWEQAIFGTWSLTDDILRANFKLKRKKIGMEISYYIIDWERSDRSGRDISNLDEYKPQWLIDFFRSKRRFSIQCETRINDCERDSNGEPDFRGFESAIGLLVKTIEMLSSYEEVYETISPDSFKKVNQLYEDIAEEVFKAIWKPKHIEIDLGKFAEAVEITIYILEEFLNYSNIAEKFSKVSEIISELTEARKELFLKIS